VPAGISDFHGMTSAIAEDLVPVAALVRGWDAHILAILGDGPPRYVDAFGFEPGR